MKREELPFIDVQVSETGETEQSAGNRYESDKIVLRDWNLSPVLRPPKDVTAELPMVVTNEPAACGGNRIGHRFPRIRSEV